MCNFRNLLYAYYQHTLELKLRQIQVPENQLGLAAGVIINNKLYQRQQLL